MARSIFFCLLTIFLLRTVPVEAQQPAKVPRIGFLSTLSVSAMKDRLEAFRHGLREFGYTEGQNIILEYRYSDGKAERLPELAAELVRLRVDVLVSGGGNVGTVALKKATASIPIVMTVGSDPIIAGLVPSLARPGGNITGLSQMNPGLIGKQLELLKEVAPQVTRVAVVTGGRDRPTYAAQMKEIATVAQAFGSELQPVELRGPNDLENVFSVIVKGRAGGIIGLSNPPFTLLQGRIAEFALKNRLAAVYVASTFAEAGGLMNYGPHYLDLYRRAAYYVDKILKGANAGDLPVEQPTKFELIVNLKTAKQIGLTVPETVLYRADKVIR